MRFGATPVVEVNIPWPAPVKRRSSQCGKIALSIDGFGRQEFVNVVSELLNCRLPFDTALTVVNGWPKKRNENGSVTELEQSSQLLPGTIAVPGSIVAPVAVDCTYVPHVPGVGVGDGVGEGDGVGDGPPARLPRTWNT